MTGVPKVPLDLSTPQRLHVVGVGGPGRSATAAVLVGVGPPGRGGGRAHRPGKYCKRE